MGGWDNPIWKAIERFCTFDQILGWIFGTGWKTWAWIAMGGIVTTIAAALAQAKPWHVLGLGLSGACLTVGILLFVQQWRASKAPRMSKGLLRERPGLAEDGELFLATDTQTLYWSRNGSWTEMVTLSTPFPSLLYALNAVGPQSHQFIVGLATIDLRSGTPKITESQNVGSFTDEGTGKYTINWGWPFRGDNYSFWINVSSGVAEYQLTGSCAHITIKASDGTPHDPKTINVLAMQEKH